MSEIPDWGFIITRQKLYSSRLVDFNVSRISNRTLCVSRQYFGDSLRDKLDPKSVCLKEEVFMMDNLLTVEGLTVDFKSKSAVLNAVSTIFSL